MSTATDRRDGAIRTRNRPAVPGAPFIPELDKAAAGGVATLDGSTALIPPTQLGTGVADGTTALFGDQSFKAAATAAALTAEANARTSADSAEAVARAAADVSEATTRSNADIAEASARSAGDALALQKASNLSDLPSAATARTSLGLGSVAVEAYTGPTNYTPTIAPTTSGTITLNVANDTLEYTRLGSLVHVQGKLVVASVAAPVGVIQLSLPVAAHAGTEGSATASVAVTINGATAGFTGAPTGLVIGGTSLLNLYEFAAGSLGQAAAKIQAGTEIYLSFTYHA